MAYTDQLEAYFRRADLDGDGRISGNEAVAFFQGANLPKPVLAQIWMYADQNKTGFLGRPEFYNALRLVTVAQSKRDLTPDIVKAALYGPAAAKIPAPQINLSALSAPMAPQMGMGTPPVSQGFGFRGPGAPNQNYFQPKVGYRNAAWSPQPGFGQHQGMQGSHMMPPGTGLKPSIQGAPQADRAMQPNQQNLRVPGMEGLAPNQLDNGKHDSSNSKPEDPNDASKKGLGHISLLHAVALAWPDEYEYGDNFAVLH